MSEPDGPVERMGEDRAYYDSLPDDPDDAEYDEGLLDIAQARMTSWAIDRVLA